MKVFAILTASLMSAGGAAYCFQDSCSTCSHAENCPVATAEGCCSTDTEQPSCCEVPCPACATDCSDCCAVCELCCAAGAQALVSAKVATSANCCAAGDVCCLAGAACCNGGTRWSPSRPLERAAPLP